MSAAIEKALKLVAKGLTPYAAAKKVGIDPSAVYRARAREGRVCTLSTAQIHAVRNDPRPLPVIAEEYGITEPHARAIKFGLPWRHTRGDHKEKI